jgi:hypothetical protein
MRRTLALFGAGTALGAALMYFEGSQWAGRSSLPEAPSRDATLEPLRAADSAPEAIDLLTLATGAIGVAERAAIFRLVAEADRATLETLAAQVASLPPLEGRKLALEALLTRYAEIDPRAAVALTRTLGLPGAVAAVVYETWARTDARGALQALGELPPQAALTFGIAVLEAIGNDGLGIARVLGAAPQLDADRFRVEAALAKAADDPAASLEDLLGLPATTAGGAFERLAVIWLEHDAYGAMAGAEAVADETLRNELKGALTRTWANLDPDALVDYFVDLDTEGREELLRLGALQAFALVDPQRALQAAETVPGDLGAMMKRAALLSVAQTDPLSALRIAETLPSAAEREPLLSAIAASYGRTDPEAAFAWAQSLDPPSPHIVANVLAGLARVAPDRAIDLLFRTMDGMGQRGAGPFMTLVANGSLSAEHTGALAARLLAAPNRSQELTMLTSAWAQREPHDAARWLLANASAAPRNALGAAALNLARDDPPAAIALLDAVPPERRATWLSAVAEGYAQNDARAAATWIAPHRGEAGYDAAVAAIAGITARTDAAAAARLFDSIDPAEAPDAPQTAQRIASAWARQDSRAAAAWAGALTAEAARVPAVREVAAQWAARDAAGARGWALGLAPGDARDAALTQLLGAATADTLDHVVLDAFSTESAQQRGVGDVVRMLAVRDPAAARRLADRYLTDAGERQAAQHFIERNRNSPVFGPSVPFVPPAPGR